MEEIQTLIQKEDIQKRIKQLAQDIQESFNHEDIVVICILKGAFVFCADLVREFNMKTQIDFMAVSSSGNNFESSGNILVKKDIDLPIVGKNVLIVEDIIDTGLTLKHLKQHFENRQCKTVKICTLLNKPSRRVCDLNVDFIGFDIPDEFVVGYGIDYAENYRQLDYIAHVVQK